MTTKKSKFSSTPPIASNINEANALISELWEQLRHYEDRLKMSSVNSSKSPSSDGLKERAERKKPQSSSGRNPRGAKQGHEGHKRQLSKLKESDNVVDCYPENTCPCCGNTDLEMSDKPFYRHQIHEIPPPRIDLTEYRLYSGKCTQCGEAVKAQKPSDIPQGIMGPNLMSHIAILAGQYHLSVRKIRSLLQEQFGTTFSVGAISEAQSRIASMLTPLHQAIKTNIQSAPLVHVDETSHSRNDEERRRWCWLVASDDLVYEKILYSRSTHSAKTALDSDYCGIVVSDQYSGYNWLSQDKHQLCWSHVIRNLQQIADYSGKGYTAKIGQRLVLLSKLVFRTRHRWEAGKIDDVLYLARQSRLRCRKLKEHSQSLWLFLTNPTIPLTNNEAERRLRGFVIQRKISYGTTSDAGDKSRDRVHSLIETCKKRQKSSLETLTRIVTAVISQQPYPNVFDLNEASFYANA
ncbi:IS66 family transposase [Vibrio vulnificus]|nr:IS66 family transposase [Vibrio vulnificus]